MGVKSSSSSRSRSVADLLEARSVVVGGGSQEAMRRREWERERAVRARIRFGSVEEEEGEEVVVMVSPGMVVQ